LYSAKSAVAITVGGLILHQGRPFHRAFGPLFLGLAVVYLACGTGWMGLLAWLLVAGAGAGAMILTLISRPTPVVINLPTPNAPTPQVPPPLQPPQP